MTGIQQGCTGWTGWFRPILGILCILVAFPSALTGCGTRTRPAGAEGQGGGRSAGDGGPTPAREWPLFRGDPGLTGTAQGELPDELELRWTFKTGDDVVSSAVVAAGRVFVGSYDDSVYALGLADGGKLWSYKTGDDVEASPIVVGGGAAGGSVVVGSADSFLYSLSAVTGELLWKVATGDQILAAANLAVHGGTSASSDFGELSRAVEPRELVLVGSYDTSVYCVDVATGGKAWTFEMGDAFFGTPAVADGRAFFGGCDATVHVVSVAGGKVVKEFDAGGPMGGSVALRGGRAYYCTGMQELVCADMADGGVVWTYEGLGDECRSSPAVGETRLVVGSTDGTVLCFARGDGKLLWTFETRDAVEGSPVICGGKVVVGSLDGRLHVLGLADGREIWRYDLGAAIRASPAVAGGFVVIGSGDGTVFAFGPRRTSDRPRPDRGHAPR